MAITYDDASTIFSSTLVTFAGAPTAVFPVAPTNVRVDLNIAGVWTNVTGDVYTAEGITITRGRTDEASAAQPSSASLAFNNRSGNYTPRNPNGAYYPNLTRNTPIRIGVGTPPAGSGLGNQASSASIVAPASTAELAGTAFSVWANKSPTGTITPPAGYAATAVINGTFCSSNAGATAAAAGAVATATATASVPAASAAATCVIPGTITVVAAGTAFQNYSYTTEDTPTALTVASALAGDVIMVGVVWSQDPNNAMVVAPWDTSQASEWSLTADSGQSLPNSPRVQIWTRYCPVAVSNLTIQAHNWVLGSADVQIHVVQLRAAAAWNPRFHGFCSELATTADLSGKDIRCAVTAGSILRQRGQGQQPARSAFFRYLSNSGSVAYWPLEGGIGTAALASPFPGVPQATVAAGTGSVAYGDDSTSFAAASDPLPNLVSTYVQGYTPAYTAGQGGAAYGASFIPTAPTVPNGGLLWALFSGGTLGTACIFYTSPTQWTFQVFNTAGALIYSSGAIGGTVMVGVPRYWFITWNPTPATPGTTTDFAFGYIDAASGVAPTFISTSIAGTIGTCSRVSIGQEPTNTVFFDQGLTVGHMAVASSASLAGTGFAPTSTFPKFASFSVPTAWRGELAPVRLIRLCQEESIPLSAPYIPFSQLGGNFANAIACGPQAIDNVLNLIATTQATDLGELAESRCTPGLMYRSGTSMTGIPVAASVDFAGKMIGGAFEPTDDDQLTRNDVTVTQQGGAAVEVTKLTGPLSIALPPSGVGVYTQSVDVTAFLQSRDLPQIASLYLAQGTIDQQRFKSVTMPLESVPTSVTLLSSLDIGNRVQIINTPTWVQPGPSDQIILGLTEYIGPIAEWPITFNAKPYGPNAVARLDSGDTMSRLDSSSSTVIAGWTSGQTVVGAATAAPGEAWLNASCPFDILVGGERMTVTSIAGTNLTVTRAVNGVARAHSANEAVHVYWANYVGLAAI